MVPEAVGSNVEYIGNIIYADSTQIPGKIARSSTSTMVIPGSYDPRTLALTPKTRAGICTEQEPWGRFRYTLF
jgi:hypothetical protein